MAIHLSRRVQLVELHAQVGRVGPRVHRQPDLQGSENDPLHHRATEVAELRDGLDGPLREHVQGERLITVSAQRGQPGEIAGNGSEEPEGQRTRI